MKRKQTFVEAWAEFVIARDRFVDQLACELRLEAIVEAVNGFLETLKVYMGRNK
ncbi:MAG: hypothetical protein ABFD89_00905 [Bryobacteraceae bacterium]